MASTGSSYPSKSSVSSDRPRTRWGTVAICICIGIALVLADRWIRAPLHVPGWRGLIAMALLVAARRWSLAQFACTGAAVTALALNAGMGGAPLSGVFSYLIPAIVLDLCFLTRSQPGVWPAAIAGGLANATRLLPALAGGRVPGVTDGALWYPIITHFLFGACGSLIAFAVFAALRSRQR